MSLHKDTSLKEAILNMPQKEKDKLLIRLVNKDKMLIEQLHFQLIEDDSDLESRIADLKTDIDKYINGWLGRLKDYPEYDTLKNISSTIRYVSGLINKHEKITKDKFSTVECKLIVLEEFFQRFPKTLTIPSYYIESDRLERLLKSKVKNVITLYNKLHEDLQFDLRDQMEFVLQEAEKLDLIE